ncbi:acyl-CoA thioesterase [Jidongwangia harbinensis]|uniref:acyl-CoA thioesterase n=1 Tax=Jidongwangia harbinensis TaxID=2878561 RepID=UPI001CD97C41|nr:thioesterase family protein [Jidongwangia harbinensis]MCA2218412.1 acyl-CoA thioesterase [Jidongwangia harbinensis]
MAHTVRINVRTDDTDTNGHVRNSRYLDYGVHARWLTLLHSGLDPRALAARRLGPVDLETTVRYRKELVIGDDVDVLTRFLYPEPRTVNVLQTLTRASDGVVAAEIRTVNAIMDLQHRKLLDDVVGAYRTLLTDHVSVDLDELSIR